MTNTSRVVAALVIALSSLVGVPLGSGAAAAATAEVDASICASAPEIAGPDCGLPGDDNGDGLIMEDESGWSCVDDGNRICGPGNTEGKPAACYDEGGVIVALWPCGPVGGAKR